MEFSRPHVLREATLEYLETLDPQNPPNPETIAETILTVTTEKCREVNATRSKGEAKWRLPVELTPEQIADVIATLYPVCNLVCAGEGNDDTNSILAIYQTSGENKGIYVTSEQTFLTIARQYNYGITPKDFDTMLFFLRNIVPKKERNRDKDLIAVNNGIFNYATKTLQDFDPDIVFISKSHVDYNANAKNVTIHNDDDNTDWDVENWMKTLSDDPEIVNTLWEILSAIIRPHVRWNKSAWLYSERGNNGKGTLCELMRSLCGKGAYTSIPISDFSKDFMLEPLTHASAVIVDENDVGSFIDRAANLKAVITNDVIQINRKFKMPIAYQFYGFMVQCLNEFPRVKDKSDSFYRRQLFIPMEKCFTGIERKYIKNDYLHRKEVLEYVLYKVLNTNFYTLSEPARCKEALNEYKEFNDPIRQYWDDFKDSFQWDILPIAFLYDLYKAWFRDTSPNGTLQGRNTFFKDLKALVEADNSKIWSVSSTTVRTNNAMDKPEPLSLQYNLAKWLNHSYTGNDRNKRCIPPYQDTYSRALVRI